MNCKEFHAFLGDLYRCHETEDGFRVSTTCLLPSHEQVNVYISRAGEGFRVHDGGEAYQAAWDHGRNDGLIRKQLAKEASRFRLKLEGDVLVATAFSKDWLPAVVLAVANAAALASNAAVDHFVAANEADLKERIFEVLKRVCAEPKIKREFEIEGKSGKSHRFDFALGESAEKLVIMDGISPHHASIAHKYTSFSDVKSAHNGQVERFAVFDKALESQDVSLMQQVADLIPLSTLSANVKRAHFGYP